MSKHKKLLAVGTVAVFTTLPTIAVFATTGTTVTDNVEITINQACTITTTNASNTYSATMSNSQLKSDFGTTNMTIACNDANGWHLTAVGTGADASDKTVMNASGNGTDIVTGTATSGATSNWAMRVTGTGASGFTTFASVPSVATNVAGGNTSVSGATLATTYQVWISATQEADTYTGQVTYTLSHPYAEAPLVYYMQDVATWGSELSVGDEIVAKDRRDGKEYTVAKLADNNIWMTQNLDLDLTAGDEFTHSDTDLGWTPGSIDTEASWTVGNGYTTITKNPSTGNFTGWVEDNSHPYSADPGDMYYYTSNTTDPDTAFTSLEQCKNANHTEAECKHYKAGNYYNFTAAIASNDSSGITSGNAPNSICPAGWRLPKAPSNNTNEFGILLTQYNVISSATDTSYKTSPDSFNTLRSSPLYFVRSGYVYGSSGALSNATTNGGYWSSTVITASNARGLNFNSSSFGSANNYRRHFGWSLRCLAR